MILLDSRVLVSLLSYDRWLGKRIRHVKDRFWPSDEAGEKPGDVVE